MSVEVTIPKREAFFASRLGVCVYVSVEGHTLRVCFESLDGHGKVEGTEPTTRGARALVAATEGFLACRESLGPLFDQIAEASRTAPHSQP